MRDMFTFSASISRGTTIQPAIQNRSTYVEWKEILLMPRFGERQADDTTGRQAPEVEEN
jgi:hypothetical protein